MRKTQIEALKAIGNFASSLGDITCRSAQRLAALNLAALPFEKIQSVVVDWKVMKVDGSEELMPIIEIKSFTTKIEEIYP